MSKATANFPNPLAIHFGDGTILVHRVRVGDHFGLMFKDSGEPHEVGADANDLPDGDHTPVSGEVYLLFKNKRSAEVVREVLDGVIERISSTESTTDEG